MVILGSKWMYESTIRALQGEGSVRMRGHEGGLSVRAEEGEYLHRERESG